MNPRAALPGAAPPPAPLARLVAVELTRTPLLPWTPFLAPAGLPEWEAQPEEASRPTALLAAQGKAFVETLAWSPESRTSRQLEFILALRAGEGLLGSHASSSVELKGRWRPQGGH